MTPALYLLMNSDMVVKHIQRKLQEKSEEHTEMLHKLGLIAAKVELPLNVHTSILLILAIGAVASKVGLQVILVDVLS